jgi:acyl-CoA reductase-like NAD-dependent aldehyde dehydrogenase
MIEVNAAGIDIRAPVGGYKRSGNGREYGRRGFEEFLEVKSIVGYGATPASLEEARQDPSTLD